MQKVVRPARSSVVNLALGIALGYSKSAKNSKKTKSVPNMTRSIEVKISTDEGGRDDIIESRLVSLYEAHIGRDSCTTRLITSSV